MAGCTCAIADYVSETSEVCYKEWEAGGMTGRLVHLVIHEQCVLKNHFPRVISLSRTCLEDQDMCCMSSYSSPIIPSPVEDKL